MSEVQNYSITFREGTMMSCSDLVNKTEVNPSQISENGMRLEVGNWVVEVSHKIPGRVKVVWSDPATHKSRAFYRVLKDGIFHLETSPTLRAYWYHADDLNDLMRERFNIHRICTQDPNQEYHAHLAMRENSMGDHAYACVLTDGKLQTTFDDDPEGKFDPDDPEDVYFYCGGATFTVSHAAWTVFCKALEAPMFGVEREIILYTDHPNLYLLALDLEAFLSQDEHGNFGDYLTELEEML